MVKRSSSLIVKLLQASEVVTFKEIKKVLGEASRATTFRYLKQVQYMRSYNHNGRYYAFRTSTGFDLQGLCSKGDILFSRDGKLGDTVKRLVQASEAGMTQRELQNLLKVRVQVLLLDAVRNGIIVRELVDGFYLYLHHNPVKGDEQLKARHDRLISQAPVVIDDSIIIEVLLILIRAPSSQPNDVVRSLRGHLPPISKEQVFEVFSRYNLEEIGKKKGSTVS